MRELLQSKIPGALPTMVAIQSFGSMCGYAGAVAAALIGSNGHVAANAPTICLRQQSHQSSHL
jgi:hypothetical protein